MAPISKVKKLKLIILGTGVIVTILAFVFIGSQYTNSPSFCSSCHAMESQYKSWQESSHCNVACIKCHDKPGILKVLGDKYWAKKTVQFISQLSKRPIKILSPVKNEVCLDCHSENRKVTPSGDLIIPHERHRAKNVRCIACHQGMVHGNKMNIEVMKTRQFGEKSGQLHTPPKTNMNDCLECHVKKKVTIACEACHTDIAKPPSHNEPNFGTEHGLQAQADVDGCNKCHSCTFSKEGVENEQDRLKKYARGNVFCYDCHQKRPANHKKEWLECHPESTGQNKDGCLVCHSEEKPQKGEKVTKTFCYECHDEPHQSNWRKIHPSKVKTEGTATNKCFDCHSQNQCYNCHTGKR